RRGRRVFVAKSRRRLPPQAEAGGHSRRRPDGRDGAHQITASSIEATMPAPAASSTATPRHAPATIRKPSPVAAGGSSQRNQGGGFRRRRKPGDIRGEDPTAATGPARSAHHRSKQPSHPANESRETPPKPQKRPRRS